MKLLVLDFETSGLEPERHQIVEAAGAIYDVERATMLCAHSTLVGASENEAEHVNGIPLAALIDAPPLEEALAWLVKAAALVEFIVAHNAEFDRRFAPHELRDARQWLCSIDFDWPRPYARGRRTLVHVALALGLGVASAHRAHDDVTLLVRCIERSAELGADVAEMVRRAALPRVVVQAQVPRRLGHMAKKYGFQWEGDSGRWTKRIIPGEETALPFPVVRLR